MSRTDPNSSLKTSRHRNRIKIQRHTTTNQTSINPNLEQNPGWQEVISITEVFTFKFIDMKIKILWMGLFMVIMVNLNANTIYVNPGTDLVQQAVANASSGDVIIMTSGVHKITSSIINAFNVLTPIKLNLAVF